MTEKQNILLADDNEADLELLKMAFQWAKFNSPVHVVKNGQEAIDYLQGEGPYEDRQQYPLPTVLLLDLNMPVVDGFEVLAWLKTQPSLKRLTVIILTVSSRMEDVERSFDLGAHSFLVKPPSMDELVGMIRCLRDWLKINHFPDLNKPGRG